MCLARENASDEIIKIKNDLIGVETVSIGSITASTTTPRDIFKSAILANAVAIIVCHNHPSGELVPSKNDIEITKQLIAAGELLGIKVLDHLIVSNQGYKSLRDHYKFPN